MAGRRLHCAGAHKGELIGFSGTTAHHLDIGALTPGSCGIVDAIDAHAEEPQFRAIDVDSESIRNEAAWQLPRDNIRASDLVVGDVEAQAAASRIGAERMTALVKWEAFGRHHAADRVADCMRCCGGRNARAGMHIQDLPIAACSPAAERLPQLTRVQAPSVSARRPARSEPEILHPLSSSMAVEKTTPKIVGLILVEEQNKEAACLLGASSRWRSLRHRTGCCALSVHVSLFELIFTSLDRIRWR